MIISKHCNTMGKYNNIFDNITKLLEAGLLSSKDLKKEIDRLNEYIQNLELIDKKHQDLNGQLRLEITRLKGGI